MIYSYICMAYRSFGLYQQKYGQNSVLMKVFWCRQVAFDEMALPMLKRITLSIKLAVICSLLA